MKRPRKKFGIWRILVPSDFSPPSNHALDYAAVLAEQFGAEIILMHVIESLPYSVTDTFNVVEHRRALEATAGSLLDNLRGALAEKNLIVTTLLSSGAAYQEILKKSQEEKADLIVMGTHGRTGVKHLLLGSVAEKVVRLSTCPVLTMRMPEEVRSNASATLNKEIGSNYRIPEDLK